MRYTRARVLHGCARICSENASREWWRVVEPRSTIDLSRNGPNAMDRAEQDCAYFFMVAAQTNFLDRTADASEIAQPCLDPRRG